MFMAFYNALFGSYGKSKLLRCKLVINNLEKRERDVS
jgi:hypothetical protein